MTTAQIETRERLTPGPASSAMLWEYAPSLEATDHAKLQSKYNLFIGGKFVEPPSKHWFQTIQPAPEKTPPPPPHGGAQNADPAVQETRPAHPKACAEIPPRAARHG